MMPEQGGAPISQAVASSSGLFVPPPPALSATMSLEDVVKYYGGEERSRTDETRPRENASVRIHISSAADELVSSVNLIVPHMRDLYKGVTKGVLTKCMGRHLLYWYRDELNIDSLSTEYALVFTETKKGHTALRKQLERPTFEFCSEPETVDAWWEVGQFVLDALGAWCNPFGAGVYQMLVEGIAWSLTTLEHREWDESNIVQHFLPEVSHVRKIVEYRKIDLDAFRKKIEVESEFLSNNQSCT